MPVTILTGRNGAADALLARMAAGATGRTVLSLTCMGRGGVPGIPVGQQRLRTVAAIESGGSLRGRAGRPARHRPAPMPWPCSLLAVVEFHERSGGSGLSRRHRVTDYTTGSSASGRELQPPARAEPSRPSATRPLCRPLRRRTIRPSRSPRPGEPAGAGRLGCRPGTSAGDEPGPSAMPSRVPREARRACGSPGCPEGLPAPTAGRTHVPGPRSWRCRPALPSRRRG